MRSPSSRQQRPLRVLPWLTICRSSSADVQLAAINALYNSLEFVRENFSREVCIPTKALLVVDRNGELTSALHGRASAITSCKSSAKRPSPPRPTSRSRRSRVSSESCTSITTT